ncbi:AAA family ATPase [Pseudomonas fluorescens]|uniref:Endonuclease GajA/Old nuclease/RecF-like AAA domain-containing protein n=1 Tax=Pseudomonas fluorescens TaxID=294 RepID=A0A423ME77_PSEFL|nr:AAA family ATPase [Pseudomonas fluorescens]RON81594.1 hypothetical protein BK670_15615 [Pseudomonas fluorescens]
MKNIKSLRIRNLRSFGLENDFVPLKKLNLLVGRNSSGKSTFLRTFPLIRQSAEADTRSPILWYGSFVDFGDLQTATRADTDEVMFDFKLNLSIDDSIDFWEQLSENIAERFTVGNNKNYKLDVGFTLGLRKGAGLESTNRIQLEIESVKILILYSGTKVIGLSVYLDDVLLYEGFEGRTINTKGNLIPTDFLSEAELRAWPPALSKPVFRKAFVEYIAGLHHSNKKREAIVKSLTEIVFLPSSKIHAALKKSFSDDKTFLSNLAAAKDEIVRTSFAYLVSANLSKILSAVDEALTNFYKGVRYLGPVRASAERFYRYQDLQVGQVDHTGSNLPMVLNSLGVSEKAELNNWILENFEFELDITNTGSHYAIKIKDAGSLQYYNVSDMGFGYSQLLPIIVSIWLESREKNSGIFGLYKDRQLVFAIEQPELHLHPHMQHKFGKAIAKIANLKGEDDFCFIVETHSKHIIDSIGESIEDGIIKNSDVNVSLFDRNDSGVTSTSGSGFDEHGYLEVWPAGFLSP